jgi:hypothetical protein
MNQAIELAQALRQLPLESPMQNAWPSIQNQTSKKTSWPTWAMATAASTALAFVIFFQLSSTNQHTPAIVKQNPSQLDQLIDQSAQMENSFYAQQDDAISSASLIAANLSIEDQLTAIDLQLAQPASQATALSLWQSRIDLLGNGIRLNKTNAALNSQGQNYDLALASIH